MMHLNKKLTNGSICSLVLGLTVSFSGLAEAAAAKQYVSFGTAHGTFMKNEGNGGSGKTVSAGALYNSTYETMYMTNLSDTEACIANNSLISIISDNGYYWSAQSNGDLDVDRLAVGTFETFQLVDHTNTTGCIEDGDEISLYNPKHGTYVRAGSDGGGYADRTTIGSHEKLTLNLEPEVGAEYLDYGLHWVRAPGGIEVQTKAVASDGTVIPPSSTNFYDDSKPTVIYFHGWQSDSSEKNYRRENFTFADDGDSNSMKSWKNRGWNVGVFYWNQFADESEVKDAEAKIWSANGPKGMRYRLNDGSVSMVQSPNKSVGELAFEQISAALANNTSGNIRFAGHSLGNQLAVYAADLINDAVNAGTVSENVMPSRIALLDPFWSQDGKSYLGDENGDGSNDWVGEKTRWAIADMIDDRDVAVEWYKSSAIFDLWIGDQNSNLEDIVMLQNLRFWYLSATDIAGKHINARHWYFKSMSTAEPEEVTINWLNQRNETGWDAASARTSDDRIRGMMATGYEWDQVEGRYTAKTSDDQFEVKK
jgi:hypothetical protein